MWGKGHVGFRECVVTGKCVCRRGYQDWEETERENIEARSAWGRIRDMMLLLVPKQLNPKG